MLIESDYWKINENYDFNAQNLNLSEYYIGYNGKGFSKWCDGGSTITLLQYFYDFKNTVMIDGKNVL